MDYLPPQARDADEVLADAERALRVALRARPRLSQGAARPAGAARREDPRAQRVALASRVRRQRAGSGEGVRAQRRASAGSASTRTCINRHAGSWFFLGEILTDLPLPVDAPATDHCGTCRACIDVCPTQAIVAPYELDATRCISYLTIELRGAIPDEFRKAIGNRIYGCDDCQLVCPWNKFARFDGGERLRAAARASTHAKLVELFAWSEEEFLARTEGSAIRRIGYECWLRNIAVALGNAPTTDEVVRGAGRRAAMIRRRWCASTCSGRWNSTLQVGLSPTSESS